VIIEPISEVRYEISGMVIRAADDPIALECHLLHGTWVMPFGKFHFNEVAPQDVGAHERVFRVPGGTRLLRMVSAPVLRPRRSGLPSDCLRTG
jgi:hypothetical protein